MDVPGTLAERVSVGLVWLAASYAVAPHGVTLTGAGYSLVYPGLGAEAIRRAPAASRGLAMEAYIAFFDLSLGLSSPAPGLVASGVGLLRCSAPARSRCSAPPPSWWALCGGRTPCKHPDRDWPAGHPPRT